MATVATNFTSWSAVKENVSPRGCGVGAECFVNVLSRRSNSGSKIDLPVKMIVSPLFFTKHKRE